MSGVRSICFESFAHANDFVSPVAQSRIEPDGLRVGVSDLQVDLGTPSRMQQALNFKHYAASESLALPLRRYRQVVDPATISFVSGHSRSDDRVIGEPDQEQLGLDYELSGMSFRGSFHAAGSRRSGIPATCFAMRCRFVPGINVLNL